MSLFRAVTIAGFMVGIAALFVLEWRARHAEDESRVPRFADVCGAVLDYRVGPLPVGRIAVLGFWWWVGWHFFAR